MSKYMIKTNKDRCISCKACEVHCKAKNRVPPGAKLGLLVSVGPIEQEGDPAYLNQFMPCFQCEKPWCVAACPTGAMSRREKDGIVFVDQDLCVGCKACIMACPWEIPQFNEATGTVIKCDFCRDRVDEGLKPACVTACTSHALNFLEPNLDSADVRKAYALKKFLRR